MKKTAPRTHWHRLLGKLLELLLTPVGITVQVDFPLMSEPPRADILLLRRLTRYWTEAQLAYLADGLRATTASHILLELKYTESLTAERIEKVHGYDIFYRTTQELGAAELASFILSAKTPHTSLLRQFGYEPTQWAGVYHSPYPMVERVDLIVLNELEPVPYNLYFKLFASQKGEKKKAFDLLGQLEQLSQKLWSYFVGLKRVMLPPKGVEEMSVEITPEYVMEMGSKMRKALLKSYTIEERLLGLKPEEILTRYKPEERLLGLKPEEILTRYNPEERLLGLKPEERLRGLKPEERLIGMESYLIEQKRQEMLKSLQKTLRLRLKASAEQLAESDKLLRQVTLTQLEELFEVALTVETWDEFMRAVAAQKPQTSD